MNGEFFDLSWVQANSEKASQMKIQYNSMNRKQSYLSSPGEAGEPHQEAGQPLGGRDWCQSWLQGGKHVVGES